VRLDQNRVRAPSGKLGPSLCTRPSAASRAVKAAKPNELSAAARTALGIEIAPRLTNLRDAHRANLAVHRTRHGFSFMSDESISHFDTSKSR
jgi:hypothetical protein